MSETYSDDTNVLLLIPPYFFLANSSSEDENSGNEFASSLKSTVIAMESSNHYPKKIFDHGELNDINKQINEFELSGNMYNHSTPKSTSCNRNLFPESTSSSKNSEVVSSNRTNSNGFLKEIDNYLLLDNNYTIKHKDQSIIDVTNTLFKEDYSSRLEDSRHISPYLTKQTLANHNKFIEKQNKSDLFENSPRDVHIETPLISLSDIWNGTNKVANDNLTLHEERMRRLHCEKSIQVLQARLLEYQQKISIALTVDRAKDEAIKNHTEVNLRLKITMSEMRTELSELKAKAEQHKNLESDLKVALELVNKLQENNRLADTKLENLARSSNEIRDIHKNQIDDLEIRLSNSLENEKLLHAEISQLKSHIRTLKSNLDKSSALQKELKTSESKITELKQVKSNLLEKNLEERLKYEKLERNLEKLQHQINEHEAREKSLINDMEAQKVMLKNFYQKQLEEAVRNKLNEFQQQLETVEDNLRDEGKQRERLIAERAVKQMELFNQKSEEEINLLKEKHNEEISLYRLQLVNACKTIDELDQKLHAYKNKRADIAERLHSIMETQWQKALEVITSPPQNLQNISDFNCTNKAKPIDPTKYNKDKLDGISQRVTRGREDNVYTSTTNHQNYPNKEYTDKLNEYIDLLLKKSPRDLDKLEEVINKLKKAELCDGRDQNGSVTISGKNKPPWR